MKVENETDHLNEEKYLSNMSNYLTQIYSRIKKLITTNLFNNSITSDEINERKDINDGFNNALMVINSFKKIIESKKAVTKKINKVDTISIFIYENEKIKCSKADTGNNIIGSSLQTFTIEENVKKASRNLPEKQQIKLMNDREKNKASNARFCRDVSSSSNTFYRKVANQVTATALKRAEEFEKQWKKGY